MGRSVKLYTINDCPHCKSARNFLHQNRIPFTDYDVAFNKQKAAEMKKISGAMSVPVIDIDGEIITGFDEDRLKKALLSRQ